MLAQGEDIVPIPGTKRRARLEENVKALEVRLSAEDLARIDRILPPGAAVGESPIAGGLKIPRERSRTPAGQRTLISNPDSLDGSLSPARG